MSPPRGETAQPDPGSRKLETGSPQKRKRGHRGESLNRKTVRAINSTADERLAAWLDEDAHPNITERTTNRLVDLFEERRDETAGDLRDPYYGRTMAIRKDRVTVGRTVKAKGE